MLILKPLVEANGAGAMDGLMMYDVIFNWAKLLRAENRQRRCGEAPGRYRVEELENRLLLSGGALNLSSAVFVENRGQWADGSVKYAYNGQGINIGFTDAGAVLELARGGGGKDSPVDRARVTMSFEGAENVRPVGVDRSATSFNYLVGPQSQHRLNVPGYSKVSYAGLYEGIDLLSWGQRDGMKYEFHVSQGADWREIRVNYGGTGGLSLGADGSLHIATAVGDLVERAPVLYQVVDGKQVEVAGRFVLLADDTYGFAVTGAYDTSRELVIDPDLSWATYLGGTDNEYSQAIAVDGSGNSYVTGYTASAGWATAGAFHTTNLGNNDIFVAKLDPTGATVLYTTYLGGSGVDIGTGIAVDGSGNAYVTGYTASSGWATAGAFDSSFNGVYDGFVAKLNPAGSSLLYATYVGGSGADYGYGIAVDGVGAAYVTGYTGSSGWATAGAADTSFNGGDADAFVAKVNASGASLAYATYFGGANTDYGNGIAIDGSGNAFVTGQTASAGLATAGAGDASFNGGDADGFVAKFSATGATLLFATYLGGGAYDTGNGIGLDGLGNVLVAGSTMSGGWATAGAYDTSQNGASDVFVAKLDAATSAIHYVTYLGGSGDDFGTGIAVDAGGNAYVTGYTGSSTWATAGYNTTSHGGYDGFIAKLSGAGSFLLYASFIGGGSNDLGYGIAVDSSGNGYVTGNSFSSGWATAAAANTTQKGGSDGFVVKFTGLNNTPVTLPGDANNDGKVDFQDLVAIAQNYGGTGKTRAEGDVTGDGLVDFQDLVLIAQNYGVSLNLAGGTPAPQLNSAPVGAAVPAVGVSTPAADVAAVGSAGALVGKAVLPAVVARPLAVKKPRIPAKVVAPAAMRTPVLAAPKAVIFNSRKRVGDGVWDG